MLTEEQIEKLASEFKENLRKGNSENLDSFYDKESWVLEQSRVIGKGILEEASSEVSKKKTVPNV